MTQYQEPSSDPPEFDRLTQLRLDRALVGLSADETQELAQLKDAQGSAQQGSIESLDELELLAAMIAQADVPQIGLPTALREKIREQGGDLPGAGSAMTLRGDGPARRSPAPANRAGQWFGVVGWLAAAAAIAFAFWPSQELTPPPPPTLATQLAELKSAPGTQTIAWVDPTTNEPLGEIVWSDQQQIGYASFVNLPANDPAKNTYQVWMFDATRDDKFPVDGGMFNISASQTDQSVILPLRPRVPVRDATLFAVTVEQPGGVVVSDRSQIVALAKVPTQGS